MSTPVNMKILFLTDGLAPFVIGGMQQHSTMMVKHLAPLVEGITVMHCGYPNEAPASDSDVLGVVGSPSNVNVIGLIFKDNSSFPGHYVRASKKYSLNLYNTISKDLSSFDVVYAQGFTGHSFLGRHKKLVSNLHGLEMFQKSFSLKEKLEKLILINLASRVIQQSSFVISLGGKLTDILFAKGVRNNRIIISPNGISADNILPISFHNNSWVNSDKLHLIFIGRDEERKGLHILRNALSEIQSPLHLTLVGEVGAIESQVHTIDNIGLIKSKDDLFKLIDKSQALVVPSLSEGMPTVILEAMARGKAIIATDVGAVSELVDDSNGMLIPPNDVKTLANAIENLGDNDIKKASEQSLEKVASFTWDEIALRFLNEIKSC